MPLAYVTEPVTPRAGTPSAGARSRRLLGVLLAVALACFWVVVPNAPASAAGVSTWDTSKPCPSILIIGARGSGQEDGKGGIPPNSTTLGLGAEVYGFASRLAVAAQGKGTVAVWNTPYPAIPVDKYVKGDPALFGSVDAGILNTRVMVRAAVVKCGSATKIVLAGFSQGAWVAGDGADFVVESDRQHIAALVLIADPGYSSTDHGIGIGTAVKTVNGVAGPVGPPAYLRGKTVSVCNRGDAVCQSDVLDLAVGGGLVHTVDYRDAVIQGVTAAVAYSLLYPTAPPVSGGRVSP